MDDESILDEDILWRRIPPDSWIVDRNLGKKRPTTKAFQNSSNANGMSVNLSSETTIEETLAGYEDFYLVGFTAGFARSLEPKQIVVRKPEPENPAHCEVAGKKTKGVKNNLSINCQWVVEPK